MHGRVILTSIILWPRAIDIYISILKRVKRDV